MKTSFWRNHLALPLLLFALATLTIELAHIDLTLADWLFRLEGRHWILKEHLITSQILHDYAQQASRGVGVLFFLLAVASPYHPKLRPYQKGLWLIVASLVSAVAVVALGKQFTQVHCPWDVLRYGGKSAYLSPVDALLQSAHHYAANPAANSAAACFPAGHASAGYGFIALYFFFLHYNPHRKWMGLSIGLSLGLVYGIDQQLRGAHFLSHDTWTLAICWFSALFWFWLLFKRGSTENSDPPSTRNRSLQHLSDLPACHSSHRKRTTSNT